MPNLVRQIGEEPRTVELRQATVTAIAADGTVTIHFGTGAAAIAGIRRLGGARVTVNAAAWVLQQGYDMLVLGQVFPLDAYVGVSGAYTTYAQFSHWDFRDSAPGYGIMHHPNGDLLLSSTTYLELRHNNVSKFRVDATSNRTQASMLWAEYNTPNNTHGQRPFQTRGTGLQGVSLWHTGAGVAPQMVQFSGVGERFDFLANPGATYVSLTASAFVVGSSLRQKTNVRPLGAGARGKVKALRPIRFKREHTSCANCKGKGRISPAEYLEHVHGAKRTADTPANLLEEQTCPICGHNGTPGKINSPTVDRNDDRDYLSFAAEDVAEVVPEAVVYDPTDMNDPMSEPRPAALDLMALLTVVAAAVQELDARLEALEAKPA